MVALQNILLPLTGAIALAVQALTIRVATRRGSVSDVLWVVLLTNVGFIVPITTVLFYPEYGLTLGAIGAFVGAGIVGTVLGRVALFAGIRRVGASRAEPIKASTPLFAAVIAVIVLGEQMTPEHLLGVVLIAVGIATISWEKASGAAADVSGKPADLLLPLSAALLFAIEPIFAKAGFSEGTPFFVGLAIKTISATVGFFGYLRWRGTLPELSELVDDTDFRWYVAAGIANTVFLVAFYASLSVAPVVIVVPIIQGSPLFVVLLSYVFLQDIEHVTAQLAAGVFIVVIGGVLVTVYG